MSPRRVAKPFDPMVLKLADRFLNEDDEVRRYGFDVREARRMQLAQAIQDAIEVWFREHPLPPTREEEW